MNFMDDGCFGERLLSCQLINTFLRFFNIRRLPSRLRVMREQCLANWIASDTVCLTNTLEALVNKFEFDIGR